jgi:23S rRNA U2552 (ribose-2'-O)-methylase RlmE/FtsJ
MVKKLIFTLSDTYTLNYQVGTGIEAFVARNDKLHSFLKSQKNFISEHFWTKKWDKYKKYANDYELVFTSGYGFPSISKHTPISRSYFKLWEILHDFESIVCLTDNAPKTCAFLAEGPGGFIEAYCNLRNKYSSTKNDKLYGMTLISIDRNIPSWKLSKEMLHDNNITLVKGDDGTGSLYNYLNILHFIQEVGAHTCEFVTADGGFDFSYDFNNQEELSTRLILSEIVAAIQLQKQNGSFLLKIYDINSMMTLQLLYVLKLMYGSIAFIKPLSSRPANSEKYVMCTGFCGNTTHIYTKCLQLLKDVYSSWESKQQLNIKVPTQFLRDIVEYNTYYIIKQVLHINKTIVFISLVRTDKDEVLKKNVWYQLMKALKWCFKYNICISNESLKAYTGFKN